MQKPNDDLEKIFNERFQDYEAPVDDTEFDAIRAKMQAPTNPNKKRYALAALLLLFISTCTYIQWRGVAVQTANEATISKQTAEKLSNVADNKINKSIKENIKLNTNTDIQNIDNQLFINKKENNKLENKAKTKAFENKKSNTDFINENKKTIEVTKQSLKNIGRLIASNPESTNTKVIVQSPTIEAQNTTGIQNIEALITEKTTTKQTIENTTVQNEKIMPFELIPNLQIELLAINNTRELSNLPSITQYSKKQAKTSFPIFFNSSITPTWTSYRISSNKEDDKFVSDVILAQNVVNQRLGLRLAAALDLQLHKKLIWRNEFAASVSPIIVEYKTKEIDNENLNIFALNAQSISVQPSFKTTDVAHNQLHNLYSLQSGLVYNTPFGLAVQAAAAYQYDNYFKASRWTTHLGIERSFKLGRNTLSVGPFVEIPLSQKAFSLDNTIYVSPTFSGINFRIGK